MAVSFWELDFTDVGKMLKALKQSGVTDFRAHFAAHPEVIRTAMELSKVVDMNEIAEWVVRYGQLLRSAEKSRCPLTT